MSSAQRRLVEGNSMDKQKALDAALVQIERAFGKGSVMKLGARQQVDAEVVSTGSLGLDHAPGIGGLTRGRGGEKNGPGSTGTEIGRAEARERGWEEEGNKETGGPIKKKRN